MLRRIAASVIYRSSGLLLVDPDEVDVIPKSAPPLAAPPAKVLDGAHSKEWWRTRDDGEVNSIEGFWASRTNPARTIIAEEIAKLGGSALLEVGCHAGPNLWAAEQLKHFERIAGTELSPTVLAFARSVLPHAELVEAEATDLPFADRAFDITLASVTLCCIGPEEIEESLDEILRVSRRWIVIADAFNDDPKHGTPLGNPDIFPNTTYWIRNYAVLFGDRAVLRSVRYIEHRHQMGHIRTVAVFETTAD